MSILKGYNQSQIRIQNVIRNFKNLRKTQPRYYYYLACRTQIARSKSIIPLEKLFQIIAMGIQECVYQRTTGWFQS